MTIQATIEQAFKEISNLDPQTADPAYQQAVQQVIAGLNCGDLRVAQKISGIWQVNEWIKKAVLLYFRLHDNYQTSGSFGNYFDKIPSKFEEYDASRFQQEQIRVVPPATVRDGVFVGKNTVLMPSYLNIGAYVGDQCMIDIWATIGSCAQIGHKVHVSANVCIGGVLEPLQATPVIIEDNCFIGAGSVIAEGVIVEQDSVIAMGTQIGASTKIYDRQKDEILSGIIPSGSVVIPGTLPNNNGSYNQAAAIIIKTIDKKTRERVAINELLRTM